VRICDSQQPDRPNGRSPNYWTAVDELLESFNLAPFGARFRSRSAAISCNASLTQPDQLVALSREIRCDGSSAILAAAIKIDVERLKNSPRSVSSRKRARCRMHKAKRHVRRGCRSLRGFRAPLAAMMCITQSFTTAPGPLAIFSASRTCRETGFDCTHAVPREILFGDIPASVGYLRHYSLIYKRKS
jgi:hypothetical protein